MSSVIVAGDTSGSVTLQAQAVSGSTVLTLPAVSGTLISSGGAASFTDLTTTGNTILGDASTDTLNVGNGGLVKDASGNVGIGVTPSAWSASNCAVEAGAWTALVGSTAATSGYTRLMNSSYYNGTNFIYKGTGTSYVPAQYVMTSSGAHQWFTAASGTAGNAITFTQAMTLNASGGLQTLNTIGVGNATPSTSGSGITFPATQSASTDANTLDDYEEGTFTPTIIGTTTAGTGTYSANSQIGRYTKIGNRVYFTIYFVWTAHTGTGNMSVAGLPFTSIATAGTFNALSTWYQNITMTALNLLAAYVNLNATIVSLSQTPVGGGAATAVAMDTAGSLMLTGHYEVA
jgi:hypothetical protein